MKSRIICLLPLSFFCSIIFSQEIIKPVKCVYTAEDGRIYINKNLPVYLRLTNSPENNAPSVLLTSDSTRKYGNPMYFDTEGRNTFYSPWAVDTTSGNIIYPKKDIVFEVYVDGTAPKTSIAINTGNIIRKNETAICKAPVKIMLTGYDAVSGIAKTYISIDSKPFGDYLNPLELTEKGEYHLKYYSIDRVGNIENLKEQKIKIN